MYTCFFIVTLCVIYFRLILYLFLQISNTPVKRKLFRRWLFYFPKDTPKDPLKLKSYFLLLPLTVNFIPWKLSNSVFIWWRQSLFFQMRFNRNERLPCSVDTELLFQSVLDEMMVEQTDLVRLRMVRMSNVPDTLYMVNNAVPQCCHVVSHQQISSNQSSPPSVVANEIPGKAVTLW